MHTTTQQLRSAREAKHPIVYSIMKGFVSALCQDRIVQRLLHQNWIVSPVTLISVAGSHQTATLLLGEKPLDRGVYMVAFNDCLEDWRKENFAYPEGEAPMQYKVFRKRLECAL